MIQHTAISLPILRALQASCQQLNIEPRRTVVVLDQPTLNPDIPAYCISIPSNQALAVASGIAMANPALRVFALVESSNQYANGAAGLLEATSQNQNITIILRNHEPQNSSLSMVLDGGVNFIARGFAGDAIHMQKTLVAATRHDGLAVVEIIEPDRTSARTYAWYRQNLEQANTTADKESAWKLLQQTNDRLPVGVLYQKRQPSFQTQLLKRIPTPLVDQSLKNINIKPALKDLK